jgi:RimJ/RimL family protein N-acetyltransferase
MRLVGSVLYEADDVVKALVKSRLPGMEGKDFGPCVCLGVVRRGVLVGGIVYHNYHGFSIEVSMAFDRPDWAMPSVIRQFFSYPFIQLDVVRMTAIIGKKNKRMRRLAEGLGFKYEGTARKGFDGKQDAILYGMLKQDCKWIKPREFSRRAENHIAETIGAP